MKKLICSNQLHQSNAVRLLSHTFLDYTKLDTSPYQGSSFLSTKVYLMIPGKLTKYFLIGKTFNRMYLLCVGGCISIFESDAIT